MKPYDEPDIKDEDTIIRRINPEQHIVPDNNTGCNRISSKVFSPSSGPNGGMSVDLLSLMEADGIDAHEFVTTPVYTGALAFPARAARTLGMWIGYNPIKMNPTCQIIHIMERFGAIRILTNSHAPRSAHYKMLRNGLLRYPTLNSMARSM